MQDTLHVVYLSSDVKKGCEHCNEPIPFGDSADIGIWVNHYINHGYKLLHIGTESSWNHEGAPWNSTVAVMGKPRQKARRKQTIRPVE